MNIEKDLKPMEDEYDSNDMKYIEAPWSIIESYFKGQYLQRLVRHQIESYNDFITHKIRSTIKMFNPIHIASPIDYNIDVKKYALEIFVTMEDFTLIPPQLHENSGTERPMYPQEARLRNFTYASVMMCDIHVKVLRRYGEKLEETETDVKVLNRVQLGKIPIMLRSEICNLTLNKSSHVINKACECKYDPGGYFIINGSEKTVLAQERAAENRIYIRNSKNSKWLYTAEIKSIPDFKIISPKQLTLMLASKNNGFGHPIYVKSQRMKQTIPLFVLFRALGVISDKDIVSYIILSSTYENEEQKEMLFSLRASIVEANKYHTKEDAFNFIVENTIYSVNKLDEKSIQKRRDYTNDIIQTDIFPHCKTHTERIYFLGLMTNKLLKCKLGIIDIDDRDSYLNKRIDLVGSLLNNLFRNYMNKMVKDFQKETIKEINNGSWRTRDDYKNIINRRNIQKFIKSSTIEGGLKRALSTGDFAVKSPNSNKVGVAQVLNRLTYISSLSHLRRINTPIDKTGKLVPPRKLHNTTWGYICPSETPEGGSVGIVKNISYMAHITIPTDSTQLYDLILPNIVNINDIAPAKCFDKFKVFINGCWVGISLKPYELYLNLKTKKYAGVLNIYTSIVFDVKNLELRVCNDAGRLTRPILKVRDNQLVLKPSTIEKLQNDEIGWDDLFINHKIPESVLEYIDNEEQNYSMIAMKPEYMNNVYEDMEMDVDNNMDTSLPNIQKNIGKESSSTLSSTSEHYTRRYTHCEIHPSTIFGILASCIPFPEHNQSPRITYQCAMGKQAMGVYVSNYHYRMDKTAYVLSYPMRPLVDTRLMNIINLNNLPSGEMVIVAISTYTGYNQEDSVIINQGSIDRGLFAATIYHTEKDEDKKNHGDDEIRCKPDKSKTKGTKFANYDKLNEDGLLDVNTRLGSNDIIMGKVVPIKENRNNNTKIIKYQDLSRNVRTTEDTYIDKNYIDRNGEGYTFCKVRMRIFRKPVIGDKFSSRHGQKGTVGIILPEEDMPFTQEGIKPDIIVNPHAIPSRMTIGQLKETLVGKVLLSLGLFGDGSSFNSFPVKDICNELIKCGYEKHGNEVMYNGMTGEQIESSIFIGPTFYQRLKHMVNDKVHSRNDGPKVVLTRKPAEGRARDGGLRFGEMERDCMVSHGASKFTKERIYDASDKYEVYVCKDCGMIACFNEEIHICKYCDNRSNFALVKIPYACKLMFQELNTMNVVPRILTE